MKDPAQCVRDILVSEGIGDLMTDSTPSNAPWRVIVGPLPISPDTVVLCNMTGGRPPFPHLLINEPSVQVMVRGAKNGYEAAYTKIKDVVKCLLGMQSRVVQGDTYRTCTMISDVAFLGQDDNTRPLFSANFRFIVLPAAEAGDNRVEIT